MRRPAPQIPPTLDKSTLEYAIALLEQRLQALETYGAGGCPSCHDAELRGAISKLRDLSRVASAVSTP